MSSSPEAFLTVEDLDLMPDDGNRYELIDGELLVSKNPGLVHQRTLKAILYSVETYLRNNTAGEIIPTPGVIFSKIDAVIPDLVFMTTETVHKAERGDRIHGAPDLAIEILSPGAENARRDRVAKRYLYGKFGLKEYWVAAPLARTVEIYRLDGNTLVLSATLTEHQEITATLLPGYRCRVGDFFA